MTLQSDSVYVLLAVPQWIRKHGLLFWKEILRHLVHAMGMPMVRDKTLGMFVRDVLQREPELPLRVSSRVPLSARIQ